jgi:hypothetical protein
MDDRRRHLLGTVGTALAFGLAGCNAQNGSGDASDDGETTDDTPDDGETTAETTDEKTTTAETTDEGTTAETTDGGSEPDATVTMTLDNVGFRAWEIAATSDADVGPTGEENPTLTLSVGTRYEIENGGWSSHPLAFRAADGSPLLSQSASGEYEDDAAVDWVDDDETLAFTVTGDLAADLDFYICAVHSTMRGDLQAA